MAELKHGDIDPKTGHRFTTPAGEAAELKAAPKTGGNTHRATRRGYAIVEGVGAVVEEGDFVPAGIPVALSTDHDGDDPNGWMAPVKKADRAKEAAIEEVLDPLPKDVDYTQLTTPALQAIASEKGANVKGLSRQDLIDVIKAADDPAR